MSMMMTMARFYSFFRSHKHNIQQQKEHTSYESFDKKRFGYSSRWVHIFLFFYKIFDSIFVVLHIVYISAPKFAKNQPKQYTCGMKKIFWSIIFVLLGLSSLGMMSFAQDWWAVWSDPTKIIEQIRWDKADKIIQTELDRIDADQWWFQDENRLANTLDSLRVNIAVYLQRLTFALLVTGVTLIIYNGLRLVLSPLQPEEAANVKKRIVYILAWLLVGTWFYYLIKVVLSVAIQIWSNI